MLYRVRIENYFSFGEAQEIDIRARKSVDDRLGRLSTLHDKSYEKVPNVIALFGPNAAGKSNFLKAIVFGVWFVTKSFHHNPGSILPYDKFGSEEMANLPTRLTFSFVAPRDFLNTDDRKDRCPYFYELVLSPRAGQPDTVLSEKLSFRPKGNGKTTTIFERRPEGSMRFRRGFLVNGAESALKQVLRSDASVVSTLAQLNHAFSKAFVRWLEAVNSNIFIERFDSDEGNVTRWYQNNPRALEELQRIGRRIDLGIEAVTIDTTDAQPLMLFRHAGLDRVIRLNLESHGTRQFVKIFPFIYTTLAQGGLAIIDEIDAAMHPTLLPEILGLFAHKGTNPLYAQLWTTCHSSSVLSDLTKEEVLFCEKSYRGQTAVNRLADIDKVRRTENFQAKYLGGEYGALPILG